MKRYAKLTRINNCKNIRIKSLIDNKLIGRFAGLSCADVVNINSYYNHTKYSYVMYKNGRGINIDKISKQYDDSFKNGLEVSLSINSYESNFITAINKLALFKKLHIEWIDKYNSTYTYAPLREIISDFNNRHIEDFKTFSLCNLFTDGLYIKVGNVIYTCDSSYSNLINIATDSGIIVNIPIGEVDITPNRENLQFTDKTKKAIAFYTNEVKKELKEIVEKIQTTSFTLKQFYEYAISSIITYTKGHCTLKIKKQDATIDVTKCKINNAYIPEMFDVFLKEIRVVGIYKNEIYKVFNSGKYYNYRRLNIGSIRLDCICAEGAYLGIKLDRVTKSVTLDWYKDNYIGDKCVVVVPSFDIIKKSINHYLNSWDSKILNDCVTYLFDTLEYYNLSNDAVPESYKKSYSESHKKQKVKVISDIPVRQYLGTFGSCSYSMNYLRQLPETGTIIYSAHTKDDADICALASLLANVNNVSIITVKKKHLKAFETNRRFVLLEDFLDFPNTILKKVVTVKIIRRNYASIASNLGFSFNGLPIVKEFRKKYANYNRYIEGIEATNSFIKELLDKYETKGWYNKADVEYFSINDEETNALNTVQDLLANREEIARCIAFFMYGKHSKIGINKPHINICKYLKKFKYDCI